MGICLYEKRRADQDLSFIDVGLGNGSRSYLCNDHFMIACGN